MPPEPKTNQKRKRGKEPGSSSSDTRLGCTSNAEAAPQLSADVTDDIVEFDAVIAPNVLAACRKALVTSSAASRAALAKYRASITPDLAKNLEIVGSYPFMVVQTVIFYLFIFFSNVQGFFPNLSSISPIRHDLLICLPSTIS